MACRLMESERMRGWRLAYAVASGAVLRGRHATTWKRTIPNDRGQGGVETLVMLALVSFALIAML